jgi:putative transposase
MLALSQSIHAELKVADGSLHLVRERHARGFPASKERLERLLREHDIRGRHQRRSKATTDSRQRLPVAEHRLNRAFTPTAANQVWSVSITDRRTDEGWLHLAIVLNLFTREVVADTAHDGRQCQR